MTRVLIRRMVQTTVPTRNEAYRRFRTCDRKKVYPTMEKGWDAVHHIKRNGNDLYPDFELRPYVCEFCHRIHVGHSNMPKATEARLRVESWYFRTAQHQTKTERGQRT